MHALSLRRQVVYAFLCNLLTPSSYHTCITPDVQPTAQQSADILHHMLVADEHPPAFREYIKIAAIAWSTFEGNQDPRTTTDAQCPVLDAAS